MPGAPAREAPLQQACRRRSAAYRRNVAEPPRARRHTRLEALRVNQQVRRRRSLPKARRGCRRSRFGDHLHLAERQELQVSATACARPKPWRDRQVAVCCHERAEHHLDIRQRSKERRNGVIHERIPKLVEELPRICVRTDCEHGYSCSRLSGPPPEQSVDQRRAARTAIVFAPSDEGPGQAQPRRHRELPRQSLSIDEAVPRNPAGIDQRIGS